MTLKLPRYRCHKEVLAMKIAEIHPGRFDGQGRGAILKGVDGTLVPVDEVFLYEHKPKEGGYYVQYLDGYESFSPAAPFESGYTLILETNNL